MTGGEASAQHIGQVGQEESSARLVLPDERPIKAIMPISRTTGSQVLALVAPRPSFLSPGTGLSFPRVAGAASLASPLQTAVQWALGL